MTAHESAPALLALHAVRLLGFAGEDQVAGRFGLARHEATELLLDFEARGWVRRSAFGGLRGWSLTDAGRIEDERCLAEELVAAGAHDVVRSAHADFVPLNERFLQAATDWQIHPLPGDSMASNDHQDLRWDDRVLDRLASLGRQLAPVCTRLADALARFGGYDQRYARAAARAGAGQRRWVDGLGIDSCHVVWMQLHEDLNATLGIPRGLDP